MDHNTVAVLSQSPLFKGVDIVELNRILTHVNYTTKTWEKGQYLLLQNSLYERLIIVTEGRLKAQIESENGKTINMEEFPPGKAVALPVLFSKAPRLPVSLLADVPSEVITLEKDTVFQLCMENKLILKNVLSNMSNRVLFLSKKIKMLQLKTIRGKIAFYLMSRASLSGSMEIQLGQTKEELAREMGVTRPSLSREFVKLTREGIILQEKNTVTILKPEELKKSAEEGSA